MIEKIDPKKFIEALKEEIKKIKELEEPSWAKFIKSGAHSERPPEQQDFWYIRMASLLRRIYLDGPVGIERLRTYYGGRKRRGHKPAKFKKASGALIRRMCQILEKKEWVKKEKKGRVLTQEGKRFLESIAKKVI